MLFACDLTVSGAIVNWRAIRLLDNPWPISSTTVRSRADRRTPECCISSDSCALFASAISASYNTAERDAGGDFAESANPNEVSIPTAPLRHLGSTGAQSSFGSCSCANFGDRPVGIVRNCAGQVLFGS